MSAAPKPIGVIDIFAGPGGLGEGFSSFTSTTGSQQFEIAVSAEMEKSAHATLRLRAFYRLMVRKENKVPKDYYDYLDKVAKGDALPPEIHFRDGKWEDLWNNAEEEALNLTLGQSEDNKVLFNRIKSVQKKYEQMILIGGPPCQAYSLVGRSRQTNVPGFLEKGDKKHFLYKQYLEILAKFSPSIFIMENVKGILTSKVGNKEMFSAIMKDLSNPKAAMGCNPKKGDKRSRYTLLPIHVEDDQLRTHNLVAENPEAFVIRCENHGIPQSRHRVIIMGIREDLMNDEITLIPGLNTREKISIETALTGLPKLRSGLSRRNDDPNEWLNIVTTERDRIVNLLKTDMPNISEELSKLEFSTKLPRKSIVYSPQTNEFVKSLKSDKQTIVLNHETRGHMPSDLGRYLFCSVFAKIHKTSPTSTNFPKKLAPEHANWESGDFADRFRVQVRTKPSNTVTSHLSKDGHAFIHWDAKQCRSLTVREAARLQTFPDDYLFLGNRTQQFVQVGNAVPPLLSRQIASVVWSILQNVTNYKQ